MLASSGFQCFVVLSRCDRNNSTVHCLHVRPRFKHIFTQRSWRKAHRVKVASRRVPSPFTTNEIVTRTVMSSSVNFRCHDYSPVKVEKCQQSVQTIKHNFPVGLYIDINRLLQAISGCNESSSISKHSPCSITHARARAYTHTPRDRPYLQHKCKRNNRIKKSHDIKAEKHCMDWILNERGSVRIT